MKQIPQMTPPVEQRIYPFPCEEGDEWYVQMTADGKPYVKVIHVDNLPFILLPAEHFGPTQWIGVTNPLYKKGFIIFLDKVPDKVYLNKPIVIKRIFKSCGMGEFYVG